MSVLFVCLGNICRSPLAAVVARQRFRLAGLAIDVDSCGTGRWHAGEPADPRAIQVAAAAGYDLRSHRARQLCADDYASFDWLLAMDTDNLATLRQRAPAGGTAEMSLFLDAAGLGKAGSVPDPYHGGLGDFEAVLRLVERGVDGLIEAWSRTAVEGGTGRSAS